MHGALRSIIVAVVLIDTFVLYLLGYRIKIKVLEMQFTSLYLNHHRFITQHLNPKEMTGVCRQLALNS